MLGEKKLKFLDKRLTAKRTDVKKPEDETARPRYKIA